MYLCGGSGEYQSGLGGNRCLPKMPNLPGQNPAAFLAFAVSVPILAVLTCSAEWNFGLYLTRLGRFWRKFQFGLENMNRIGQFTLPYVSPWSFTAVGSNQVNFKRIFPVFIQLAYVSAWPWYLKGAQKLRISVENAQIVGQFQFAVNGRQFGHYCQGRQKTHGIYFLPNLHSCKEDTVLTVV